MASTKSRSRTRRAPARTEQSLDDIELLNAHRYPESVPASVVAQVRNSRVYQKRLEELLKTLPGRRTNEGNWNQIFQEKLGEGDSATAAAPPPEPESPAVSPATDRAQTRPTPGPRNQGLGARLRKLLS